MLGRRESLRKFIHGEIEILREFMHDEGERTREFMDRLAERSEESSREILLRNEKVYTAVIAELEEMRREHEEGRKQIRANTEAVLRLLDRMDGPKGEAA